jgi:hypothetical protein
VRFNGRLWRFSVATTTVVWRFKRYASQLRRLLQTKYSSTGFATTTIYRRLGSRISKRYFMSRVSGSPTAFLALLKHKLVTVEPAAK